MSNGHARLAPSSAGQWGFCPGSIVMESRYPDDRNDGDEGEASHWVGAELLAGRVHAAGEVCPTNGIVLDQEMVSGATIYAHAAINAVSEQPYCWCVEQPLTIPSIHPDCWGTPDLWYYLRTRNELHVWDYKYGWIIVDVIRNMQLILYAVGALQSLGLLNEQTTIVLHIVQPRPNHNLGVHREWCTSLAEIQGEIQRLQWAAQNALSDEPTLQSGKWCRFCMARHACPAARKAFYASLDYAEKAVPHELTVEELAAELKAAERAEQAIKYHLAGLQSHALGIIKGGGIVPGWMVERGNGRSKWKVSAQEIFALGELYKVNLKTPEAALTPAQAKMAGIPAEVVNSYSSLPLGDPKLVRSENSLLAQVFGPAAAARNRK